MAGRGGTVWGSERSAAARRELAQLGWHVAADDRVADVAGDDGAVDGGPLELLARSQRLVYSDAVPWDHPQRCLARSWGIPEISYAQMLGRWMAQGEGLAVAGTHGKSTITAMAAQILTTAGQDPSFVCGAAPVAGSRTGGRAGGGRLFLAEACEYRRNFLHLCPQAAVVSGVEADHFETYETREELERGFAEFVERIPPRGWLLVHRSCRAAGRLRAAARCPVETYGFSPRADWRAVGLARQAGRYAFTIKHRGTLIGRVQLQVAGRHNVWNALAAAGLSCWAGASGGDVLRGLSAFSGLDRRLQYRGVVRGVHLWDDFAHHPTAVGAALRTLREIHPAAGLWCVFQPHQALRTARLMDEFARQLQTADRVAVASIYRAREGRWRPGEPRAADLAAAVRARGTPTLPGHALSQIRRQLTCCPGDVLVTLGAGDIAKWNHGFPNRF